MGFIWVYKPSYNWGAPSIMESHRQACGLVSVPRIPRSREREADRSCGAFGRSDVSQFPADGWKLLES